MNTLKTASLAFAFMSFAAGGALAQMTSGSQQPDTGRMNLDTGSMNSGGMTNSSNMPSMSKMDMKTMKSCQAMSHDAMMVSAKCKALVAKHPEMMNSDGTMKTDPRAPPH